MDAISRDDGSGSAYVHRQSTQPLRVDREDVIGDDMSARFGPRAKADVKTSPTLHMDDIVGHDNGVAAVGAMATCVGPVIST